MRQKSKVPFASFIAVVIGREEITIFCFERVKGEVNDRVVDWGTPEQFMSAEFNAKPRALDDARTTQPP